MTPTTRPLGYMVAPACEYEQGENTSPFNYRCKTKSIQLRFKISKIIHGSRSWLEPKISVYRINLNIEVRTQWGVRSMDGTWWEVTSLETCKSKKNTLIPLPIGFFHNSLTEAGVPLLACSEKLGGVYLSCQVSKLLKRVIRRRLSCWEIKPTPWSGWIFRNISLVYKFCNLLYLLIGLQRDTLYSKSNQRATAFLQHLTWLLVPCIC